MVGGENGAATLGANEININSSRKGTFVENVNKSKINPT
jgi:hypothetical protein